VISYAGYKNEQADKYHSWYESGEGKIIGEEQREVLGIGLGEAHGRSLIDIGCGSGYFTEWFARAGFRAVGVDTSKAMLKTAREKCGESVAFRLADATNLPFEDRSFDVGVFAASLEFIDDAEAAIREAERVVKGDMVFLMLNPDHPLNISRREKAKSDGGVFSSARFFRPDEFGELFPHDGPRRGTIVVEPKNSSYYVFKASKKEAAEIKIISEERR